MPRTKQPKIKIRKVDLEQAALPNLLTGEVGVENSYERAQRMYGDYIAEKVRSGHRQEDQVAWDALGHSEQNAWHLLACKVMDELAGHLPEGVPLAMRLTCPACGALHIDEGEFATKVHHTHACQACGMVWRPAVHPTVGVAFLPGFKNP